MEWNTCFLTPKKKKKDLRIFLNRETTVNNNSPAPKNKKL